MREPKTSLNIAQNFTKSYYVSTGMWATFISATGMYHPTYETFIWEYNPETFQRGEKVKEYFHRTRKQALAFHFRFCRTLAYRDLIKSMPDESPFVLFQNNEIKS